jgi:hypothetical protein
VVAEKVVAGMVGEGWEEGVMVAAGWVREAGWVRARAQYPQFQGAAEGWVEEGWGVVGWVAVGWVG